MAGPVLVTDFGTSFSSAAIVVGGDIAVVKETHSGETIPSAVCDVDGELIVGALAVRRRRRAADRYQEGFKRNLGERAPVVLGDTEYRVGDLVAAVLGAVRDEAEKMVHEPVTAGVVTIPATYESARREIMRDAAAKAGLAEVELLEEPIAAAFAPLIGQRPEPGDLVLVYDFGGGTFDAALVRIGEAEHEVIDSDGLERCGGVDIDETLMEDVLAAGGSAADPWSSPRPEGDVAAVAAWEQRWAALRDFARDDVKHPLSTVPMVDEWFAAGNWEYRLDRDRFGALVMPWIEDTLRCCEALLARNDAESSVSMVLLVGGSSRIPAVAERLAAAFDAPVRRSSDPALAVTLGAAHLRQIRDSAEDRAAQERSRAEEQARAKEAEEARKKEEAKQRRALEKERAKLKKEAEEAARRELEAEQQAELEKRLEAACAPIITENRWLKKLFSRPIPASWKGGSQWEKLREALEPGNADEDRADYHSIIIVRRAARTFLIVHKSDVQQIPDEVLRELRRLWDRSGLGPLDSRWWVTDAGVISTVPMFNSRTRLQRRLDELDK